MRERANATAIDTETTVNEVIRMYRESVSVFSQLGIDACCGGDASIAEAARRDGVDLGSLLGRLDAVVAVGGRSSWGFVAMMIFGVAYHVIPRFTGHPLHSRRLAAIHWWLANGGLALFVAGFVMLPHTAFGTPARVVVAAGGILSAAASYAFVYNLWRTIDGPRGRRSSAAVAPTPAVVLLRRPASR